MSPEQEENYSFDDLMASLLVLVTHHSLTRCEAAMSQIVERITRLCEHDDIEYYPNQLRVLLKMQRLWRTKQFRKRMATEFDVASPEANQLAH